MTIPLFKTERDKIRYYRSLSEVDRYEALNSILVFHESVGVVMSKINVAD